MRAFRHILVPTDFGDAAADASGWAAVLAAKFDASITLLHVYPPPAYTYAYLTVPYWPAEDIERAARESLDGATAELRRSWPRTEGVLATGLAWEQIVGISRERDIDLVVMGTHGRRGLSRALLGSVAEKVVRTSSVPVLTVGGTGHTG